MTEKLYYIDAYIKEFDARVISSERVGDIYETVLDKTAFFPEEGGQQADTGYIGNARVIDAKERCGVIYHITDRELALGEVHCTLDFEARLEKMQCHTAEHIMCGIIHEMFGYDNVGFHLGADLVTFDVDGELTAEQIALVEERANDVVFSNVEVKTYIPDKNTLAAIDYRSKSEIEGEVRIVEIVDVDMCACCAPHVSYTGEIGIIKIVDFMRHRGGMRLTLQAGKRAYFDYKRRYEITRRIGAMTSTPSLEILDSVKALSDERNKLIYELKTLKTRLALEIAERVVPTSGSYVALGEGFDIPEMRELANAAQDKVAGFLVVLSPDADGYKYVISSKSVNLRAEIKAINTALNGRGGGTPEMVSGRFGASLDEIKEYFK